MENLALRHHIGVLTRALGDRRPRFGNWDRAPWVVLAQRWVGWRHALAIVQPATVVRWHREGFKRFWNRGSRAGRGGRPALDRELVGLVRKMSRANVTWGAPPIRNELAKLGIEVAVSTVARYMVTERKSSSPSGEVPLAERVRGEAHRLSPPRMPGPGRRPRRDDLLRILANYFGYYNRSRCHLSLLGDAPEPRLAHGPELGGVVELREVGGLHLRYERAAA